MAARAQWLQRLEIRPVTAQRWADLEALFGPRGACGGCWCMFWRLPRSQFAAQVGEGNRRALKEVVDSGEVPGLLAYLDGHPIAWCCVAPREAFPSLERSPSLKRIDDRPVWSVTCFYVTRGYRRQGVTAELLRAAVKHVRESGGSVVEGYPSRSASPHYMGMFSAFRDAGFVEVAQPTTARSIVRCYV